MATSREFKVGAFTLAGLAVVGMVVFMVGEERKLFESKLEYGAKFEDVQGLRRGSPVRMGGVDIGAVTEVSYPQVAEDKRIHVKMAVVRDESRRIREDSVATIDNKGLLGDKMIVITVGSQKKPQIPAGGLVPSKDGDDMGQLMAKMGTISTQVEKVVINLEKTTNSLADERLHENLRSSAQSMSGILKSVDGGEGYVGKLVKSPEESQRLSQVMQNLENATAQLNQTTASINAILGRIQNGPGLAHEVLYGEESAKAVSQFGGAADELRLTLKGIRDGNGLARSVIYGDEGSQQMMSNLNQMSGDLKQIVADMKSGKGTLGALLVDPSVYEDLKLVLGNVERNKALRALVRYSIRRDGTPPGVEVKDPAPAAVGTKKPDGAEKLSAEVGATSGSTPSP
ncbi:MAG TPA: MlaD family protein [Polyangiaceae bacterium]|nr:MlaD family protein [Polyangiaceae bacterium]